MEQLRGGRGAALIAILCAALSLTGHGLVTSVVQDAVAGPSRLLFLAIAAIATVFSGPLTHGLGGGMTRDSLQGFLVMQCYAFCKPQHSLAG